MLRLVGSHEFISQGIFFALLTATGRNLQKLRNKLSLQHSELYVFLVYIENAVVNSQWLFNFKINSALH
jgi:hypothetical protein